MRDLNATVKTGVPNFFAQHEMDADKVQTIQRMVVAGKRLPRPVLVDYGGCYMPLEGRHRMAAHKRLGRSLEAWVVSGKAFDTLCTRGGTAEAHVMCEGIAAMQVAALELNHLVEGAQGDLQRE